MTDLFNQYRALLKSDNIEETNKVINNLSEDEAKGIIRLLLSKINSDFITNTMMNGRKSNIKHLIGGK